MSETVHYKGYLEEVKSKGNESLDEILLSILEPYEIKEIDSYYGGSVEECFIDKYYREYVIYKNKVYKAIYSGLDPDYDILEATPNPNGTINFEVKYYNGGCSFYEAIEVALNRGGI